MKNPLIKGTIWSAIERFSTQGVQFILSIIIARLVSPSEYGLIAMLTVFISVAQVFVDSGLSSALIQKKDRNDIDYSTVQIFNFVVSVIVYSLFFFIAPLISLFFEEPRLTIIVRILFLNIVINSICLTQRTRFIIDCNFKYLTKVSLFSVFCGGIVGIVLAYNKLGVWALVVQSVLATIISNLLLVSSKIKIPKLYFSVVSFKSLCGFGSKVLLTSLLSTIYENVYNLVIGKVYKATELGYYNRAYTLSQFPSRNISSIFSRVMYPAMCERQDEKVSLLCFFDKYIRFLCFIVFPLMVGLCVLSEPFISLVLSEKWLQCADYLSILCIAYMFYPLMVSHFDLVNALGYSNLTFKAEIWKKTIGVLFIGVSLPFGVKVLCIASIVINIFDIIIMIYYVKKVLPYSYSHFLVTISPIFLLSLFMGIVIWGTSYFFHGSFEKLICGLVIGLIMYLGGAKLFNFSEFNLIKCKLFYENNTII